MYEENMHTNTHTNVWKKPQLYDKITHTMYEKKRDTNVWQGGELPRLQLSAHQSLLWVMSGDWTANSLFIGRPHSPLRHGCPKYKHTLVWEKHAYKCMKKTRIQTRIQMYEKNMHTNVWKKGIKTRIQTHIQMNEKNMHSNEWQKHEYKIAYKCMKKHAYKHAYKCMKKTCI